ncbi:MAG: protease [Allomuricauda sp.]|nr:MAG: protease [Allomuricauda sp.]
MSSKNKLLIALFLILVTSTHNLIAQGFEGYYQHPDIHQNQIVFVAEGDIWKVPVSGGLAQRLTTHAEQELYPIISPDGKTLAYSATYEGPYEVYTLPIDGGLTTRWTYESDGSFVTSWTPDGKIVYQTWAYSKRPDEQLVTIDLDSKVKSVVPLYQASEGIQDEEGNWYFIRPADHNNVTKRYKGGTARQIWKFDGSNEAVKLTTDHDGESFHPMWYNGRIYFITDRDGMMNIWSMNPSGGDLQQHTQHEDFDVRYANLDSGKIVYQHAADLWLLDIATGATNKIDIRLASDLEQLREKWDENPSRYITSVHPNPKGDKIAITARGRVFVVPVKTGRTVSFTEQQGVRFRDAVFSHDGNNIITLSDQSGEFEFVQFKADGSGTTKVLTKDGNLLRYQGIPSPDGKYIAYDDLEANMYVLNVATGVSTKISTNQEGIWDFSWSPDSQWLAFVQRAMNTMAQIKVFNVNDQTSFDLTTDRANSFNPKWSPDGKFLYFLSDRSFTSLVGSPWGTRQPEPYWDASEKVYHVALQKGTRSPFREKDELMTDDKKEKPKTDAKKKGKDKADEDQLIVTIDKNGIQARIVEVPIAAGNYNSLTVNDKALYLMARETGINAKSHLKVVKITNEKIELKDMVSAISGYEMTQDGKKLLVRKGRNYFMVDAGTGKASLDDAKIDISGWKFAIDPKEDWKQIFTDAWRMERDYFYDKNMHGVAWDAMYKKYLPLVDRVTTRQELSDLIGRFVGELSALHTSVRGGDTRSDNKQIAVASLGAEVSRDASNGGFRIDYIYKVDPDYPDEKSPLDDPYLGIKEGDVITQVNGRDALSALDLGELIRNQAGKQVRLRLKRGDTSRDVIVKPTGNEFALRYRDWEYGNRLKVENDSEQQIGYLHLRAMGSRDISQFYREFYPVFNRKGLIVDVRYNWGGNIDSFILEKLLRKAWMYWKGRSGETYWNMPYSFRGHIVVLVNENTYSDGEAFADGFRRLGLGTTIGTRTWGGEIWLNSANRLTDNGLARAPMFGVYGPEGEWLIEGHGFVPDIELDNLPHETFKGKDAQLDAAVDLLLKKIAEDPRDVPRVPAYPDKSFKNNRKN